MLQWNDKLTSLPLIKPAYCIFTVQVLCDSWHLHPLYPTTRLLREGRHSSGIEYSTTLDAKLVSNSFSLRLERHLLSTALES
jgi:hypothetical protein